MVEWRRGITNALYTEDNLQVSDAQFQSSDIRINELELAEFERHSYNWQFRII